MNKVRRYLSLFIFFVLNILVDYNVKKYVQLLEKCFDINIIMETKLYAIIYIVNMIISILIASSIYFITKDEQNKKIGFKLKKGDSTFGSAEWMNNDEIKKVLTTEDIPGIILGKKDNKIVKLPFNSYFNKNIAVFGASGSMKTRGFLMTNVLEMAKTKSSMIFTDPKGEIYRETSKFLKDNGYIIKVFNLKDLEHSDRWNPLRRK